MSPRFRIARVGDVGRRFPRAADRPLLLVGAKISPLDTHSPQKFVGRRREMMHTAPDQGSHRSEVAA
jgi:hypothetical protein